MIKLSLHSLFVLAFTLVGSIASAQLVNSSTSKAICEEFGKNQSSTLQQTWMFVDLKQAPKEGDWWIALANKLENSLYPREVLRIFIIDSEENRLLDAEFDSCFPQLTDSEIETVQSNRNLFQRLFQRDPASQNANAAKEFRQSLMQFIERTYLLVQQREPYPNDDKRGYLDLVDRIYSPWHRDLEGEDRIPFVRFLLVGNPFETGLTAQAKDEAYFIKRSNSYTFGTGEVFVVDQSRAADEATELELAILGLRPMGVGSDFRLPGPRPIASGFHRKGSWSINGSQSQALLEFHANDRGRVEAGKLTLQTASASFNIVFEGRFTCSGDVCQMKGTVIEDTNPWSPENERAFRSGDTIEFASKDRLLVGEITANDSDGPLIYSLRFPGL